ncbi:MAG TPA: hypothetical protein VI248_27585 [Kineosporiaceae bacterium]
MRLLINGAPLDVSVMGEERQDGVRRPMILALHGGPGLTAPDSAG